MSLFLFFECSAWGVCAAPLAAEWKARRLPHQCFMQQQIEEGNPNLILFSALEGIDHVIGGCCWCFSLAPYYNSFPLVFGVFCFSFLSLVTVPKAVYGFLSHLTQNLISYGIQPDSRSQIFFKFLFPGFVFKFTSNIILLDSGCCCS